jgi:peptide-methionine (S)-S-oxide reductase
MSASKSVEKACFALGCYWGPSHYYKKEFGSKLLRTRVGFMGGREDKSKPPSYEDVCSGRTGHAEVVYIEFDPSKVSFQQLVSYFYRLHDPTTVNRQGNDRGTQYRSAVFYFGDEQKRVADHVRGCYRPVWQKLRDGADIVTEHAPAAEFHEAHEAHQDYLDKNPGGYCNHRVYVKSSIVPKL